MLLALTAVSALAALSSPVATRTPAPGTAASSSIEAAELDELRLLYGDQRSEAAARREQADATQARLNALGAMRDRLWPLQPKLQPHDIPVITLDRTLTADALRKLFAHECCAVHVRGFCSAATCADVASRLGESSVAFSNWNIHQAKSEEDTTYSATEVDKIGVTSGEAMESFEQFTEYLRPSSASRIDSLLPGELNPFTQLRAALDELHPKGCRLGKLGRWALPAGTFRRMFNSRGLIHADTATLLSRESGEFSANLYIQTPPGRGSLSVYPAQQYVADAGGLTSPALLADLQSLMRKQSAGFDRDAQQGLRAALPIQRTIDVADGDLVLISTGRFHGVESYGDSDDQTALRLSGQCWLSFRKSKALRMWV